MAVSFYTDFLFDWAKKGVIGDVRRDMKYDSLVVFGSSYSANGHPDDSPYSDNKRSNASRVWVEYLEDALGVKQLNFARSGATIDNSIHHRDVPDIVSQVAAYKSQYDQGKEIVAMFTTTNDITMTWEAHHDEYKASCGPDMKTCATPNSALEEITKSAESLINQLKSLVPRRKSGRVAPDFLIFPILPVDLAPQSIKSAAKLGTDANAIKAITEKYNEVLMNGAGQLARRLGKRGNVFVYDVPGWFRNMVQDKSKYGLERTDKPCPNADPDSSECGKYLWKDDLHLLPHAQRTLSSIATKLIRGS